MSDISGYKLYDSACMKCLEELNLRKYLSGFQTLEEKEKWRVIIHGYRVTKTF